MKIVTILLIFCGGIANNIYAQTCTAVPGGGDWNTAATWDCGIVPDGTITNVVIPAGVIVTTPAFTTVNYDGQISVYGTLTIGLFGDLNMALGSSVDVFPGGSVSSLFGTITVDGVTTFITFVSPVPGPATIDENGNGPLPITLIEFNATSVVDKVKLTWATASEENFDFFSIERSIDGENFKEIAQLQGVGESFERIDYEYIDEFPLIGRSYYRLRSIDFDGYTEIFDYKMVEVEAGEIDFSIFPNPISGQKFSLQTNFDLKSEAELVIYSAVGRIEQRISVVDWLDQYTIDGLQTGNYLFKLISADGVIVKRILIE